MIIGFVTPWPPQCTGIADYAYDLISGLARRGHHPIVYTDAEEPKAAQGVTIKSVSSFNASVVAEVDHIVYQMGNNSTFHLHMIPLLTEIPGTVHLHDMVLHHLMAFALYANGDHRLYRRVIAKYYGAETAKRFYEMLDQGVLPWDAPEVTDYPLFEDVLCSAPHCIVHSQFARQRIEKSFPALPIDVLPQLYPPQFKGQDSRGVFKIGILGGVDPQKRAEIVVRAAAKARKEGAEIEVHLVGSLSPLCKWIIDEGCDLGLGDRLVVHGRLADDAFLQIFSEMNVVVALRYPTMGETSAIVMRALQAGIPVIVNDIGWYGELPSFIPKLEPGTEGEVDQLSALLSSYALRGKAYQKLLTETKKYAEKELVFNDSLEAYVACLEQSYKGRASK